MNAVQVHSAPAVVLTETMFDRALPFYTDTNNVAALRKDPGAINEFIETIAWFKSSKVQNSYVRQITVVDKSQFTVVGKGRIKVKYLGSTSAVSVPNSVYAVTTTLPDAPKLLFYTMHFGSFVTTFAIYGGLALDVSSTSRYVNLAEQRLLSACE